MVFMHTVLTAVFVAVILCLTYGLVSVCRSLNIMIDVFCCDIIGELRLHEAPPQRCELLEPF